VEVRPVRSDEHEEAGQLVVAAYRALPGDHLVGDYATELADVAQRSQGADVLVAVDPSVEGGCDEIVGCVTFVPDWTSPWAEYLEPGESGIRMLAVRPLSQRRGIGRLLVDACISRAQDLGRDALMLHTTPWMTAAHHLYEQVGFVRFPARDWFPLPEVPLLSYRLELGGQAPD
jgi:ribosomal protein S18 acetylase RimI-like enzyme